MELNDFLICRAICFDLIMMAITATVLAATLPLMCVHDLRHLRRNAK